MAVSLTMPMIARSDSRRLSEARFFMRLAYPAGDRTPACRVVGRLYWNGQATPSMVTTNDEEMCPPPLSISGDDMLVLQDLVDAPWCESVCRELVFILVIERKRHDARGWHRPLLMMRGVDIGLSCHATISLQV